MEIFSEIFLEIIKEFVSLVYQNNEDYENYYQHLVNCNSGFSIYVSGVYWGRRPAYDKAESRLAGN